MVNIRVLNENFELAGILDLYESFIWTERYSECGDFEFYAHATPDLTDMLHPGMYLQIPESEYTMIIETVSLDHDFENGDHITLQGRSLESLLDRRIIWKPVIFKNISLASLIKTVIYNNIIDPEDSIRKVDNFIFYEPIDGNVPDIAFDSIQLFGESLYDLVSSLCTTYKVGFKILWEKGSTILEKGIATSQTIIPNNDYYVFYLYSGSDRSYRQTINPYVVFSPEYDNVLSSNFVRSTTNYKTSCLVVGEGEAGSQTRIEVKLENESGDITGFERREVYLDQSSLATKEAYIDEATGEEKERELTPQEYMAQLFAKGNDALAEMRQAFDYDGQIDPTQFYTYKSDYYIGDLVQVVNEYGMESVTRVTEYIRSYGSEGISTYPTFTTDTESPDSSYSSVHTGGGSGGGGGGGGGTLNHNELNNRGWPEQHPIDAITSLTNELEIRPDTAMSILDIDSICK